MTLQRIATAAFLVAAMTGCASVKYGDKDTEAKLKQLQPVPGKTSVYVCREDAALVGAGNRATAIVDGKAIGTLKPNNFAHTVVEPGTHDVKIKRNPGGESGSLTVKSVADEIAIVWVGMTGGGFGVLTVDQFSSRAEAEKCVKGAEYAVPADE
jgi:hypothetical protein